VPSSIEYIRIHQHKLLKKHVKSVRYDIRKYYFTERIVNMLNSLPDAVVNSSTITNLRINKRQAFNWSNHCEK